MSPRLQVLLVAPYPLRLPRGNSVTIERIAHRLRRQGARVRVLSPGRPSPRTRCNLVHAFHAYRAGPRGLALARQWKARLVVTLTGTDLSQDLGARSRSRAVRRVLESADAIIAFDARTRTQLRKRLPGVAGRVRVVPQGIDSRFLAPRERGGTDFLRRRQRRRRRLKLGESDFVFLYASGIRAVKDPFFLLRAFPRLHRKYPQARLVFVGPVLERAYGRRFLSQAKKTPGVVCRPVIPPREMPGLYAAADVVVNSSRSEGMSNAVLEAMGMGLPVLARAIDANRNLVLQGRTGLLFRTAAEFAHQAERLLGDPALRRRLAEQARSLVCLRHHPEAEAAAHMRLYHRLLRNRRHA